MADINYTGDVYIPDSGRQDPVMQYPGWSQAGRVQDGTVPEGSAQDHPTLGHPTPGHPTPGQPESSSLGAMSSVVGAMVSLALVVGIGVWGYKLMIRDVSGVPVVRAIEGPMRIQPDNPGGQQADHQGLAVNAIAAAGTAAPTAERLMLAPRPVELSDDDAPQSRIAPGPELADAQNGNTAPDATAPTGDGSTAMSVNALVEQLTAGVEPLSGEESPITSPHESASQNDPAAVANTDAVGAQEKQDSEPEAQPAVLTGPGLARSLRPLSRPARAVASDASQATDPVLASAINAAVDTLASLEVDPQSLPSGTRLAQLGAYDSVDIARAEWDKLNVRFEEFMEGKQRVIQKASSGGRTFYRLRALGFDDLSAARRFCSALVSENTDCIPVTIR